jgi:hypothetical protein
MRRRHVSSDDVSGTWSGLRERIGRLRQCSRLRWLQSSRHLRGRRSRQPMRVPSGDVRQVRRAVREHRRRLWGDTELWPVRRSSDVRHRWTEQLRLCADDMRRDQRVLRDDARWLRGNDRVRRMHPAGVLLRERAGELRRGATALFAAAPGGHLCARRCALRQCCRRVWRLGQLWQLPAPADLRRRWRREPVRLRADHLRCAWRCLRAYLGRLRGSARLRAVPAGPHLRPVVPSLSSCAIVLRVRAITRVFAYHGVRSETVGHGGCGRP